ncbi:CoA-binding protein [bacterium]|nr:CoA-binding protein [bacterium]
MNEHIPSILRTARTIAVVGLSDKPHRTSYGIAEGLRAHGYTVIPVNPAIESWQGLRSYPDLHAVEVPIDIVNVFRRSEHVSDIVDDAIAVGAKVLWTQLGVVDYAAAERAERAGMQVVMDSCIAVELARLQPADTASEL